MHRTDSPYQPRLPLFRTEQGPVKELPKSRVLGACGWIDFGYRRSARRRTIGIEVHPDGSVVVAAPPGVAVSRLREFVLQRERWIMKWRRRFAQTPRAVDKPLRSGDPLPYLGEALSLVIRRAARESVVRDGRYVRVSARDPADMGGVAQLLDAWYADQAGRVLPERFSRGWRRFAGCETAPPRLTIRHMKTRWGSCNPKGRITLNQELIKTPTRCIDYVVLHELCHLRVANHGAGFWALVERYMPDYREWRQRLNMPGD